MPVGKRSDVVKVQSKGLFPGAKVSRGRDWKWADQDGGNGEIGTLTEITAWSGVERSGAKVMWNTLGNKTYRVGYQGSVRLDVIIKINNTISRFSCIYVSNSFPFLSWELGLKIDLAFVVWLHSSAGHHISNVEEAGLIFIFYFQFYLNVRIKYNAKIVGHHV